MHSNGQSIPVCRDRWVRIAVKNRMQLFIAVIGCGFNSVGSLAGNTAWYLEQIWRNVFYAPPCTNRGVTEIFIYLDGNVLRFVLMHLNIDCSWISNNIVSSIRIQRREKSFASMHSFTESFCLQPTRIFTYRQRPLKPINFSKNQQTLPWRSFRQLLNSAFRKTRCRNGALSTSFKSCFSLVF